MKIFYTCALIVILALTSWAKADFMEDRIASLIACTQEVQHSKEDYLKLADNDINPANASGSIKCYTKCVMEKQGHFKNGEFDEEGFVLGIPKTPDWKHAINGTKKLVGKCKGEKGANDCDTAFKIHMCLKDERNVRDCFP